MKKHEKVHIKNMNKEKTEEEIENDKKTLFVPVASTSTNPQNTNEESNFNLYQQEAKFFDAIYKYTDLHISSHENFIFYDQKF